MSTPAFKEHVIDLDDMLKYIDSHASDWNRYASDGWKKIEFRHDGDFRVTVHGRITYEGGDSSGAVRAYNEARR